MNEIICGDCVEAMGTMDADSVDLIVTSPPYNLDSAGTGYGRRQYRNRKTAQYDGLDDAMPEPEYAAWQRRCLDAMMRVLKPDGAIFYNQKWRIQDQLLLDRHDIVAGLPVRQVIVWHRSGGLNFDDRWFVPNYEVIYMIAKPGFRLRPKANAIGCVWRFHQDTSKIPHPAPFPIELPTRIIGATDARVVMDPFCGSGTTCRVARALGRQYIGIDISERYCEIARKRVDFEPSTLDGTK